MTNSRLGIQDKKVADIPEGMKVGGAFLYHNSKDQRLLRYKQKNGVLHFSQKEIQDVCWIVQYVASAVCCSIAWRDDLLRSTL